MSTYPFQITGLDHVLLAMPPGGEDDARAFYTGVLGLMEVEKPASLAGRGGVWFESGSLRLHLGAETDFRPAKKAHPAFAVHNLAALVEHLRTAGVELTTDVPLPGCDRIHAIDPFGNRLELLEYLPE